MIYFQKNLIYLRSKKKLTLKEIGVELDFSPSQWNNYELGISFPKFLDLIKISEYFKISETDLIHQNLEYKQLTGIHNDINGSLIENRSEELIQTQNKLIKIQEEKISELQAQISKLTTKASE
ncbi:MULTISPECIES: helix-turn-helix domain-containing protein [Flavobacterium]|uniref:Helix-turn-helix domain-containing protein n=1 Tax=Flavobacterium keumense TaxID=1306518 RepID=A0ABY8N5Z5_9FLAO|nr:MULTISPECIES: helix-turn-helix transcriptional regulator [Flavobacterium]WGK94761.1 helix-turn-helix domain-containing protein [Flavobacterium keumense]